MTKLDPAALRNAFGSFMTGVTIVTAKSEEGVLAGFTANSFTSVSMDPPLLLVCPGNHLSSVEIFRTCKQFAVNILHEDQQETANIFASSKEERFSKVDWQEDHNGVPLISGSLASFSCKTHQIEKAGDHLILIGEVEAFTNSQGLGLGYWKGGYFSLNNERQAQATSTTYKTVVAGALVERDNAIFVNQEKGKFCLPKIQLSDKAQARTSVANHLIELNLSVQLGRVYSIYENTEQHIKNIYFRAIQTGGADPATGMFLDIEQAVGADWLHEPEQVMVERLRTERNNNQFGLYIGDSDTGEIHHENEV